MIRRGHLDSREHIQLGGGKASLLVDVRRACLGRIRYPSAGSVVRSRLAGGERRSKRRCIHDTLTDRKKTW